VKRYVVGKSQWAYFLERMDDRIWQGPEDPWCVDCGLSLPQPAPNATLTASSAAGSGQISGGYIASPGTGYVAPSVRVIDPTGAGSGAQITLTVVAGAITNFTIVNAGSNYSMGSYAQIVDPQGGGASLVLIVAKNIVFVASSAVFGSTQIGDVIRMGGGKAAVVAIDSRPT
jgi:hypothetical protein